jgi:hypothetical protein
MIVVLWQMLMPGYVLTLDMVFTPKISLAFSDGAFLNALLVKYLMGFLNLFLSGWVIEKIMLVVLFFSLFYLAAKFLPVPKKHYANYWAALFYSLNPFVYERFLAGHWTHLFAYAFLPPLIHGLLDFFKKYSYEKLGPILFWTILIGMFSLHFLVMAVLIICACFAYKFILLAFKKQPRDEFWRVGKYAIILGGLFLIISSYWIAPYFINQPKSILNSFNQSNQLAFRTVGDNSAETIFNVATLYGFWGEREPWVHYFLSPKANPIFWSIILVLLVDVIFLGFIHAWRNKRKEAIFFLSIGLAAIILACGQGISPFKGLNEWLFVHIGFWRGFRDTQKFSGILALSYAYFGGLGFFVAAEYVSKKWSKIYQPILAILFLIPVFYTYTMVGGFARQLKPVWYPPYWSEVKNTLDKDKGDYKVVFLPWHQYMSFDFNNLLIMANPAKSFFGPKIIQGDDMEIGGVFTQSTDSNNLAIQNILLDQKNTPDEAAKKLADKNIKYIIELSETISDDYLKYPILASNYLEMISTNGSLTVYRIRVYNTISFKSK